MSNSLKLLVMPNIKEFGALVDENLKLIRKSKKISQEELAEKLGVSRQSVSKWETGNATFTSKNFLTELMTYLKELVHNYNFLIR